MKKIIIAGICIVILLLIVLIVGMSNLGPLITYAVNTYGPGVTGTKVSLEDVDVKLFSGVAVVRGFTLGNPEGFNSPHVLAADSVYLDVDEKTLTGDTVVIERIEVLKPDIIYETSGRTDNVQTILKNIKGESSAKAQPEGGTAGEPSAGKKFIIKDVLITGGTVKLAATMLKDKQITASLPDIHLENLGSDQGGAAAEAVFKQIFAAVYDEVRSQSVETALKKHLRSIEKDAGSLREDVEKELKDFSKKIPSILGK